MSSIAYYRVSSTDQSIEAQRSVLISSIGAQGFDREFFDEGISGATAAASRKGFKALLEYIRDGDTLHVYSVDRLGRDALDVQSTIRNLLNKNVTLVIYGLGTVGKGVGELIIAVLAQVADMERQRINERTAHGREAAKRSLAATGKTHRGKDSLGRPMKADVKSVREWRKDNQASITQTATKFGLSESTVKRYCAS